MEYWMFTLFNAIIGVGIALLDAFIHSGDSFGGIGILGARYALARSSPRSACSYDGSMIQAGAVGGSAAD